jgi:hypothetical protein
MAQLALNLHHQAYGPGQSKKKFKNQFRYSNLVYCNIKPIATIANPTLSFTVIMILEVEGIYIKYHHHTTNKAAQQKKCLDSPGRIDRF